MLIKKKIKSKQYQPSITLLENWKIWMTKEVIEQWLTNQEVNLKISDILDTLDLTKNTDFTVLSIKLKLKIEQSKQSIVSIQQLEGLITDIEKYLRSIFEIQNIDNDFRNYSIEAFRQLISIDYQQASPEKLVLFLNQLLKMFHFQKSIFESEIWNHKKKENSAWNSYLVLSSKLGDFMPNTIEYKCLEESIWNALYISFESRLNREKYTIYSQIMLNLIQLCQSYGDSANRSVKMLKQIKSDLEQKCTVDIISLPVFTNLKRIDAYQQRKIIELWVGHSLNYWGNSPVSWQQIEVKLLENIEPIALELFNDFCYCFRKHAQQSRLSMTDSKK